MRISNHVTKLINALQVAYRLRIESERDLELALINFEELLGDFAPDVLEATRLEIVRTYTGRDFPAPAMIFKTAQKMAERKKLAEYQDQNGLLAAKEGQGRRFDDDLVGSLLRTSIGRQAASEGWAGTLRGFLRTHGRLPDEREKRALKFEAEQFDQAYADVLRGPQTRLTAMLAELGENMMARRHRTERYILGHVAGEGEV